MSILTNTAELVKLAETALVLAAVWVALTLITSCAPPPDGPDAPRIIDPVHGPNYGPQP